MKTVHSLTVSIIVVLLLSLGLLIAPYSVWAKASPKPVSSTASPSSLAGLERYADKVDIFLEKDTTPDEKPAEEEKVEEIPGETPKAQDGDELDDYAEDDPFASDEPDTAETEEDTLESVNRVMFGFNETFMDYILTPISKGYRAIIPEEGRIAVRNAFHNLSAPARLVSSIVQLDADKSGRVLGRFLINSTVGLGGFIDVADQEFEIKKVDEDFGQALAVRGVPAGPYLVLPIFGPSTTRHAFGRVVDSALNPVSYFGAGLLVNAAVSATEQVNEYSFNIEDMENLEESAVDPYEGMRHFYLQIREKQIAE